MAQLLTVLAIILKIPVQRDWKIALINTSGNLTPTNAVVQPSQVGTFYLSIKSLCLVISSLGLHTLQWNLSFGTPLFKGHKIWSQKSAHIIFESISGALAREGARSGASWVRKCGKLPIRENLVIT